MATITASASGGTRNWSNTATWTGGVVPTAADDVVLASTSGNVTVDTASLVCRSLDCQATGNYVGTLTFAASASLNVGDATAGAGNRWVRLSSGMTVVNGAGTSFRNFSTSATQQTFTSAGKQLPFINLSGGGSSTLLADDLNAANGLQLTSGTFNTGNFNITAVTFNSSNSNTRTLTLGSSTVTLTGASINSWDTTTVTGLTMTANTATLVLSGANASFISATKNFNGMSLTMTGAGQQKILGGTPNTFANVTRTGTATKTDSLAGNGSVTCTGTLTLTGNSATNRLLAWSDTIGTARTITAAAVSLSNVDFMDIVGAGAATWTGTSIGNALGCSGITFDASRTLFARATGNASGAIWATTTGGTAGSANPPLPQDDLVLNANSGAITVTLDMPRIGKDLTCTGFTGTCISATNFTIYGSPTLPASGTWTIGHQLTLSGRGSHVITSNGKNIVTSSQTVAIDAPGGTYTQADALVMSGTGALRVRYGGLVSAGYSQAIGVYRLADTGAATVYNAAGSTVTVASSGSVCSGVSGAMTFTAPATVALTDTTVTTKTFDGGGKSWGVLTHNVAAGKVSALTITGANTFASLNVGPGVVLTLPSSTTTTVSALSATGSPYGYQRIPGVSGNYAYIANSAPVQLTGDAEWEFWVTDYTNAGPLVARSNAGDLCYLIGLNATLGSAAPVAFSCSNDGTTWFVNVSSTANLTAGYTGGVKITRNATTGDVKFWTAPTRSAPVWTQLGATVSAATGAIRAGTAPLEFGSRNIGTVSSACTIQQVILRNGIGGSTVVNVDFTTKTLGQDTFTDGAGNVVIISGDLAKAGDGRAMVVSSSLGVAATLSVV